MTTYLHALHDALHLAEDQGHRVLTDLVDKAPTAVADLVRTLLTPAPEPEPEPESPTTTTKQPGPVDVAAALAALTPAQRAEILAQLTTPQQ